MGHPSLLLGHRDIESLGQWDIRSVGNVLVLA
jgi:hypothetical protein